MIVSQPAHSSSFARPDYSASFAKQDFSAPVPKLRGSTWDVRRIVIVVTIVLLAVVAYLIVRPK